MIGIINFSSPLHLKDVDFTFLLNKNLEKLKTSGIKKIFLISDSTVFESPDKSIQLLKKEMLNKILIEKDDFIFIDGSKYFDFDLGFLIDFHRRINSKITIPLRLSKEDDEAIFELIDFKLKKSTLSEGYNACNIFICRKEYLDKIETIINEPKTFLLNEEIIGVPFAGNFFDLCKLKNITEVEKLKTMRKDKIKVAFVDRDGTINEDKGYVYKIEDLIIKTGVIEFLKNLQKLFDGIIIVTNQAGIAKGKFTEEDYKIFQKHLENILNEKGIKILDSFYCPYHKDAIVEKYRKESIDRKPSPGMILKAAEKYNIDLSKSIMIGDKESDVIELPYLKSYILKGQYEIKNERIKTYNSFDEILNAIKRDLK